FRRREAAPGESVHAFFARRLGEEVADRFIEPFVGGIFAGSSHTLSVEAAFPGLARRDRGHGGIVRGAIPERERAGTGAEGEKPAKVAEREKRPRGLLSLREGLETLPRKLAAELAGRLETGVRVEALRRDDGAGGASPSPAAPGWTVKTSKGELRSDRVV